jgi:hypothetical protein
MRVRSPAKPCPRQGRTIAAGVLTALAVLLLAGPVVGQSPPPPAGMAWGTGELPYTPLLTPQQRAALREALSGKRALWHVERLARYDRSAPSDGLDRAMQYIARELKAAGLEPVETTYKSDGKAVWWLEPAPPAWTCDAAELWIEAPERRQLADWGTDPIRVARFSTSCDVTADLVEVTADEPRLDVEGKIVLVALDAQALQQKVLEAGALGLLLAPADVPEGDEISGAVYASSLSPALEDWKTNRFAFNLSATEAGVIRASLSAGKGVRVRATITNARLVPGTCPIVSASIKPLGHSEERIVLVAEVAGPKPGANAVSGAAALLSIARTYKELTDAGVLAPPVRAVEFLFVPDVDGACAYVQQQRKHLDDVVAVIHLGVVGTDTERGVGRGAELHIADGGWVLHNCLSYLVEDFGRHAALSEMLDVAGSGAPLRLDVHARGPIAAHTVFYSEPARRPAVSISFFPDAATATSIDTPDQLDPTALKRAMYMAMGTAYVLAATPRQDRDRFKGLIGPYVEHDLQGSLQAISLLVSKTPREQRAAMQYRWSRLMARNLTRLTETIASLDVLLPPYPGESPETDRDKTRQSYEGHAQMINEALSGVPSGPEAETMTKQLLEQEKQLFRETPYLLWRGPISEALLRRLAPAALPVPEAVDVTALLGLVDGTRSLFDVWIEHEAMKWINLPLPTQPTDQLVTPPPADCDETIAFLRRCEQAGVIRIEARQVPAPKQNN